MDRPPAMTLTEAAVARIKSLLDAADKPVIGIRVGVKAQGCSGMSYHVEYAEKELPFEEVVEDQGVRVLIDAIRLRLQQPQCQRALRLRRVLPHLIQDRATGETRTIEYERPRHR